MTDDENSFQKSDEESLNEEGEQNVIRRAPTETPVNSNKKLIVAPHRKRNVRSQNQTLSKIAKGMQDLAGAQSKRTKLMIEADKKRDKLFLKHKADKTQRTSEYKSEWDSKNPQHELRLAQMYASVRPTTTNCDHPHIEKPHKTKKNMSTKRHVSLLLLCRCSYVLIYIAAFFALSQKRLFC